MQEPQNQGLFCSISRLTFSAMNVSTAFLLYNPLLIICRPTCSNCASKAYDCEYGGRPPSVVGENRSLKPTVRSEEQARVNSIPNSPNREDSPNPLFPLSLMANPCLKGGHSIG